MSWTARRLRRSRCQVMMGGDLCPAPAVGAVWPPKRTGQPLGSSMRACAAHLDVAQDLGWTVSRDAHVALMGEAGA